MSATLCFSWAMPTIAFAAETSGITADVTDSEEDELILEEDDAEETSPEAALNGEEEKDIISSDSNEAEENPSDSNEAEEKDHIPSDIDEAEEKNNGDEKEDNNEILFDDDMPVVSITMDETGNVQNIDSDEGILVEPALPEEEDTTDAEILNHQGEIDSEENVGSEKMQAKAAPIQGVLTDYYGTYIKSFKSDDERDFVDERIENGANSNMQKYTYYSTKEHYNHKVSITIRSEGVGLNERLSTSAGKIDYSDTSELIDVVLDPTNNALLAYSIKYNIVNLDPEEKQVRFECSVEPPQDKSKRITRVFIIKLKGSEESGDNLAAPTSPEFIVDHDKTGLLLTGIDSRMEYRKEETDTWIDCTDSNIAFAAPEANTNYYIRYKAQGDIPASATKKITAYARPVASIIRIDAATERLRQAVGYTFDKTYEMKIDNGNYFDVTDEIIETGAAPFLDKVPAGTQQTLYIRKKATDVVPAGFETQITLLPRAVTPTSLKFDNVTFQLTGVTAGMEYLNPTTSKWVSISKDMDLSSFASAENDVEMKVRVKQTATNSASRPYVFTISQLAPAPTWKMDYKNELITGFTANQNYEWRKAGTTTWKTFQGSSVSLSQLGYTNSGFNIYVRRCQTAAEPYSAAAYIKIPSRPNGPVINFTCNDPRYKDDVVLKDMNSSMQYSLDLGKTWENVTKTEMVTDFRSASYKIYFRYKATDSAFSSKNTIFTVGTRAKAPTASINKTTEILNTLSTMEYSYDNVNFTHCNGNMDMKAIIDAIPAGKTKSIYIRKFATETTPYSLTKEIIMYARSSAPTTPKYDSATQKINGMTTAMMYKSNTETTWHTLSKGTSISVASYIKNNPNTIIEIRYKATSTSSASEPLFIKL